MLAWLEVRSTGAIPSSTRRTKGQRDAVRESSAPAPLWLWARKTGVTEVKEMEASSMETQSELAASPEFVEALVINICRGRRTKSINDSMTTIT